jgi:coenzyme F420-0:L-glutamate ligase/coenzyme F420-1:gamma-L-glutamate ligase
MTNKIELIGLQGIPLINPGDDISKIILNGLEQNKLSLESGDIILIAQTIISKSIGRIRNLKDIKPSEKAISLYEEITPKAESKNVPIKTPEHIQAILDESNEILKAEHVLITETKHGFVCANAGIDKSNVEGEDNIALLPVNSDEIAQKIRDILKKTIHQDVAVIITDSFGRPFRVGAVGVALGVAGITSLIDKRGALDLFGHTLQSTIIGQVDNLASTAQLIMGEADEGLPIVILKGYKFDLVENTSIQPILREKNLDLFRRDRKTNNLIQTLKNRRSYKSEFDLKSVDINLIKECIEVARWAPSAHNGQFWRYIIIEKGKTRIKLIEEMNDKLRNDLIKDGKSKEFIQNKIKNRKESFLQAPMLILHCLETADLEKYTDMERSDNEFVMGVQSVSASATYFLLALQTRNLAACWYCAPLFAKDIVKRLLKIPKSYVPMAFFTVGYPLKEQQTPIRKKLSEIIFNIKERDNEKDE